MLTQQDPEGRDHLHQAYYYNYYKSQMIVQTRLIVATIVTSVLQFQIICL